MNDPVYSILSYTHSDPLYNSLSDRINVARGTPRENLENVLDGSVLASVVSLYSYFRNTGDLERINATNIHTLSTTGSTLLVSDGHTIKKSMRISISNETETTKEYLRLVLTSLKIDGKMIESQNTGAEDLLNENEYALVIGDEALKVYKTSFRIIMDVGYEFSRFFHMGPVYAVTVKRKDSGLKLPDISDFVIPEMKIIDECTGAAARRLSLPEDILRWYYGLMKYDENKWVESAISLMESFFTKEKR